MAFPALLTTREAAEYLGFSPRTLEYWRSQAAGPAFSRIGGGARGVRYRVADLDAFIAARTQGCDVAAERPGVPATSRAADFALPAEVEAFARRVAAQAPPMTAAQAATVARIFRGGAA